MCALTVTTIRGNEATTMSEAKITGMMTISFAASTACAAGRSTHTTGKQRCRRPTALLFGASVVAFVVARTGSGTGTVQGLNIPAQVVTLVRPDNDRNIAFHQQQKQKHRHHQQQQQRLSRNQKQSTSTRRSQSQRVLFFSFSDNKDDNNNNPLQEDTITTSTDMIITNKTLGPVDAALSWITSDLGSISLGFFGLCLLLLGRLILLDDEIVQDGSNLVVQTRIDLLAVLAIGAVLLNGLSELDVATALAEKVVLDGVVVEGDSATVFLQSSSVLDQMETSKQEIAWALDSICAATPAATAVLMMLRGNDNNNCDEDVDDANNNWKPVAYRGIVPPNLALVSQDPKLPNQTPILDRFRQTKKLSLSDMRQESYLPTLQALPGKTELVNYLLPSNTQAALLIPLLIHATKQTGSKTVGKEQAVLLLGSNQARSFTPQHVAWCQAVASRLEQTI